MNKKLISALAAGVLVLAACGSDSGSGASSGDESASSSSVDDSGSSSSAGDDQGKAADAAIAAAKAEGIELDEDCVREYAAQLSDEDAKAIVAAGPDGDPDVSEEGQAIGAKLVGCADNDQIIDVFIDQMKSTGQDFDEDCVRDNMKGIDLAELAANDENGETPDEVMTAVLACFDLGE